MIEFIGSAILWLLAIIGLAFLLIVLGNPKT